MSTTDTESDDTVPASITHRGIRELLASFENSEWSGMDLEVHGVRITVGRHGPPPAAVSAPAPAEAAPAQAAPAQAPPAPASPAPTAPAQAAPAEAASSAPPDASLVAVPSPAVGAFWVAPSPGEPPFVEVGSHVDADQQVGIVEVMKLMNPVLAPVAGEIVEICAQNSAVVEYEQPLFRLRPDG